MLTPSSIAGIAYSTTSACTKAKVGYTLDLTFFGEDLNSNTQKVIIKSLAGSLILNPIAAGLAGISLLFAFGAWFVSSRILEIVSQIFCQ